MASSRVQQQTEPEQSLEDRLRRYRGPRDFPRSQEEVRALLYAAFTTDIPPARAEKILRDAVNTREGAWVLMRMLEDETVQDDAAHTFASYGPTSEATRAVAWALDNPTSGVIAEYLFRTWGPNEMTIPAVVEGLTFTSRQESAQKILAAYGPTEQTIAACCDAVGDMSARAGAVVEVLRQYGGKVVYAALTDRVKTKTCYWNYTNAIQKLGPHPDAVPFLLEVMTEPRAVLAREVEKIFTAWNTKEGLPLIVPPLLELETEEAYAATAAQMLALVVPEKDLVRLRKLREELKKEIPSRRQFLKAVGYTTPGNLIGLANRYGVTLPEIVYRATAQRPEIDVLIEQGFEGVDIARRVGVSRQAIDYYLLETRQHVGWKETRADRKEKQKHKETETKTDILTIIQQRFLAVAQQEGWRWAAEKVLEYYQAKNWTNIPSDKLKRLFQAYDAARQEGQRYSLATLVRVSDISGAPMVGRILEAVGLDTMCCKINMPTDDELNHRTKRVQALFDAGVPFSTTDIGYFLKIKKNAICVWVTKHFGKRSRGKRFQYAFNSEQVSYSLASQLYEAKDLGFTVGERCELFGVKEPTVRYADEHRREISNDIKQGLRCLHPDRKITKPYLT